MLQRLRCTVVPPRQMTGEPLQVCQVAAGAGLGAAAAAPRQSRVTRRGVLRVLMVASPCSLPGGGRVDAGAGGAAGLPVRGHGLAAPAEAACRALIEGAADVQPLRVEFGLERAEELA